MRNEKRRPATGRPSEVAAAKPLFELESTSPERASTQLRRRRAASLRLEPLADGRRDPWPTPKATGLRSLHVTVNRHTARLYGEGIFALLDEVGIERRQWDHRDRVWMIPIQYADDVMAWAEWKQRRVVTCEAIDR